MSTDTVKQYVHLRRRLTEERTRLQARLDELNAALADAGEVPTPLRREKPAKRTQKARVKNTMSLREAVIQLTKEKPLTKKDIVAGLPTIGYKTTSKNPTNLLNRVIYGRNPKFKRKGGKYGPTL